MVFLMYHELEADGRQLCQDALGYTRYIVREKEFRGQMNRLKETGWRGVDVTEAMLFRRSTTAITFDDGCETDLLIAGPILRELGFGATFYITTGLLDTPGHLTAAQVSELNSLGFEIGCHSMTHAYLPDLDDTDLQREIVSSKKQLEDLIGKPVEHFSCPGGRYNQRTIAVVKNEGYRTLATSNSCANSAETDHFELGRIPVMRETTLRDFESYCHGRRLRGLRLRESLRKTAKHLLGNSLYDRLRAGTLGSNQPD